ncbi:flagellar hook-associated protein FlgL [Neptuniibacter sp.]|uniref:flagellar hook-associated protein FlgL n=1 Tax=Neptuniibacter sp. TaxID=1962643 RepID=UPI00260CBC1A|nr:flagellar hook-associated protein FlgL [Neptuniibacter sp.]MCP4598322.1 flagellar hook-associated protein 3 [Neptuniibacter sp.]
MRISTQQVFLSNIDNLSKTSADLFKTQQQLSTGKRVLQPSDDPLASAQIQKFKKEIARTEQFNGNIEVSQRRLELEENTIEQINNISIRLKELAIQGKNGVLTDTDRNSIAYEADELVKQLDGLMNTKDVQGEYLFSGHKGFTKPYELNAGTGRYEFQGDDGQRFIQVGPENKIASTDSGFEIFEKVPKVSGYLEADITQTQGHIGEVGITTDNADGFDEFMSQNAPLNFTFAGGNLTVTNNAGQFITADDPAVDLNNYDLSTNPNAPVITIAGVDITLESTVDGVATLDVISQHNIINTAVDLRDTLREANLSTQAGRNDFSEKMDLILENLSGIEEKNIGVRTSIGGRLNALEQQELVNSDYKLFTEEALSSFEDLDYNEAISRFELQQTVLQASYASFAKVQDLSLFNYIN